MFHKDKEQCYLVFIISTMATSRMNSFLPSLVQINYYKESENFFVYSCSGKLHPWDIQVQDQYLWGWYDNLVEDFPTKN